MQPRPLGCRASRPGRTSVSEASAYSQTVPFPACRCPPPLRSPHQRGAPSPKTTRSGINSMTQSLLPRDPDEVRMVLHTEPTDALLTSAAAYSGLALDELNQDLSTGYQLKFRHRPEYGVEVTQSKWDSSGTQRQGCARRTCACARVSGGRAVTIGRQRGPLLSDSLSRLSALGTALTAATRRARRVASCF